MFRIVDLKLPQRQRLARQQLVHLFAMVLVNVVVAERVNKLARFELGNVRDQMRQQCVRTDIKGDAEKCVGGALVKLAVQHASILDFELKERVTRRKIDVAGLTRIPADRKST